VLVSSGANVDSTSLIDGSTPIFHAIDSNNSPIVALLLRSNASTNIANTYGIHPILYSIYKQHDEIFLQLINNNANINEINNNNGNTAILSIASLPLKDSTLQMVQLLLKHGSNIINITNNYNQNIFHLLAINKNVCSIFLIYFALYDFISYNIT
jgi:serine/threonine-protein phosphatase 6 regulatory ankyrin repeat subunit B